MLLAELLQPAVWVVQEEPAERKAWTSLGQKSSQARARIPLSSLPSHNTTHSSNSCRRHFTDTGQLQELRWSLSRRLLKCLTQALLWAGLLLAKGYALV